jgi:hypothetical protein
VLPTEQQGLIAFLGTSGLSAAQVAGRKEITIHFGVARWTYEFGKSLVPREVMPELPTQLRRLHDYCMLASSRVDIMLGVWIKNEDYFRGEDVIWLNFE